MRQINTTVKSCECCLYMSCHYDTYHREYYYICAHADKELELDNTIQNWCELPHVEEDN